ncbi:LOW QUALITY PROTEIN: protein CASC3-like [Cydia splendana]|uniref:LOW QUALITY PROTEIN: protein CASC3-like n=1 Tax=Cydia splendana TaxID=1100963 RepID=UPI00300C9B02
MSVVARRDSGDYSDSQDIERNSTNDGPESDYDSAASDSEHSDQDPESQETERRVDDDEDRSNPQYIPKRGTFYEHDDRTAASGEEPANTTSETSSEKKEGSPPAERRRAPRKSEVIDRWAHDKFNENEQAPKSRDELVAIYGYDIRHEDAPPHARRNRRYGRGPNKYTRTWEDEEAYRRAQAAPRKPPGPEDFPDLDTAHKHSSRRLRGPRPRSKSQPTSNESLSNGTAAGAALRRHASTKAKLKPNANARPDANAKPKETLPKLENLTITTTVLNNNSQPTRKVNAVAQQRPVPTDQGKKKAPPQPAAPQSPPAPAPQQKASAPAQPSAGAEPRGSKRYSSLRQRPLAETYSPQQSQGQQQQQPQQQPQMRYHPAEYAGSAPPASGQHQASPHPQQLIHPVHRNAGQAQHGPAPQQHPQQHSQQVRHVGMVEPQQLMPHAHHNMHNLPPQPHSMAAAPLPPAPAPGYAPPAMMPAQYMQQGGNGAVFGGAALYAAPPPQPYPHQLYQHHNYATSAGGVTYYRGGAGAARRRAARAAPPHRRHPHRAAPAAAATTPTLTPPATRQVRPTAAIPIVPPQPPPQPLPHSHPQRPDRPANSSEKDNIDRIVENMFVRKPWPGAQPSLDGTEDPESRSQKASEGRKESSQPGSLTSSSLSTDSSKPEEHAADNKPEVKETSESIDA